MNLNKIFYLFFIFILILNNYNVESAKCKISMLMSGSLNDLGYNYMFNDARVRAERTLKSELSLYYVDLENSMEDVENAMIESVNKGANLIIVTSGTLTNAGFKFAEIYKDRDIYWLIKAGSRPKADLPKVAILDFNADILHYILGYFSGLVSKTGIVGFVSHGNGARSPMNSYYLGAKRANSSITFVNAYTGSWLNPPLARATSQKLISMGVTLAGMSQDDMSVQEALMEAGNFGLGVTGYPNRFTYGAEVGISYITNWTDVITRYGGYVLNDSWPMYSYYLTTLQEGGSLSLDEFSFKVPDDIQTKVMDLVKIMTPTYTPYLCDPQFASLGYQMDSEGCITMAQYRNASLLQGNEQSKVIDIGRYVVPLKFVDIYPNSMKLGITIVSAFCILLCIVSMVLVLIYRHAKIIRSASPAFCILILFGCIIVFIGCIIFSQSPTNGTCGSRVWLLSVGYTIFLGALLVKNWRIWLLFDNPKLKKRAITNWKLYPWVVGILAIDVMILAVMQGLGNLRAESRTGIESLGMYEYTNVCASNNKGTIALYLLIVFHGLMLLVACFISFKIKVVDIAEFNESKQITTSVYIITFCLFIVIPLMVSPQSVSSQTTIICVCSIVTTMISIALLFGKKFYSMATQGLELNKTFATSTKSSSFSLSLEKKNGEEDSDESEEKGKSPKQILVTQQSVLAQFTDDNISELDENVKDIENGNSSSSSKDNKQQQEEVEVEKEEENKKENENENVSIVKAKRLSNQLNNNTDIDSNDV